MSTEEADVLVIGAGPVGLTMAAELSYRGVSTILIESRSTTSDSPKAFALSVRTMEHFRRLGLESEMQNASYPRDMPMYFSMRTSIYGGRTLLSRKFSSWGDVADGTGKESFFFQEGCSVSPPIFCPQFTSEKVLLKHLTDTAKNAELFWGWTVSSIDQDSDGVSVNASNKDGEKKVFKGRYLVGCDGGSSFVRKSLNMHTYGLFVVARACTISFKSQQLLEQMKNTQNGFTFIANARINGLLIMLNASGNFAIHVIMSPTASDEEVNDHVNNPGRAIECMLGASDVPFEVLSSSGYNMHALVSTRYRNGRCFLAGDSAHQWLPAGGLGLNTGISDVADLAWKLEAMVKGFAGKYLADSYEIERRPLADSTRRFAMNLGGIGTGIGGNVKLRQMVLSLPLIQYFISEAVAKVLPQQFTLGLDVVLGFQYSNSNIILHQRNEDGSVRLHCNEKERFIPSSLPGCRAPHVVLPEYPTILDLFGKHFVIFIIGGVDADLKELKEELQSKAVPYNLHVYPPLPEIIKLYDRKYFLIRPDGVVAWRSDYQPSSAESARIVGTALGHNPPSGLPPPILKYDRQRDWNPAREALIRVCAYGSLVRFTTLPLTAVHAVGFGLSVLLRLMNREPVRVMAVQKSSRHQAAVIDKYGSSPNDVLRIEPKHVGKFGPQDVLIQTHASSVTELDVLMRKGQGSATYQKLAKGLFGGGDPYFPLILGRDCSGVVVAVGDDVTKFLPGDLVYAAVPPHRSGTHAELVAANEDHVAFKPSNIDHREAASIPWVALTAWSAIVGCGGLNRSSSRGKKVLVHCGTSGVGSVAVQLLKAWGANVTTTCTSSEDTTLAHHLGAEKVIVDRKVGDFSAVLSSFDVVIDTAGGEYEQPSLSTLKYYDGAKYISLTSNREKFISMLGGFLGELVFSWVYRYKVLINRVFGGRAFFYSDTEIRGDVLDKVRVLVEQGAVRPLIDAVYSLDEVISAHQHVETGQTRGKVVLSLC